ncbi:hypothetical protein N805_13690 [Pseudomonas putida S13.1.2]|uniref:Uncharacterized protein n=1 Tax=Pseudomonas putida S13.1.2 TaxID=1384061 RepID=A0AAU8S8U4_PSEPU|nr:hypothetical protein N805_13690 [Pseudomonas putida S13.1.2]
MPRYIMNVYFLLRPNTERPRTDYSLILQQLCQQGMTDIIRLSFSTCQGNHQFIASTQDKFPRFPIVTSEVGRIMHPLPRIFTFTRFEYFQFLGQLPLVVVF